MSENGVFESFSQTGWFSKLTKTLGLVETLGAIDNVAGVFVDAALGDVELDERRCVLQTAVDVVERLDMLPTGVIVLRQEVIEPN